MMDVILDHSASRLQLLSRHCHWQHSWSSNNSCICI